MVTNVGTLFLLRVPNRHVGDSSDNFKRHDANWLSSMRITETVNQDFVVTLPFLTVIKGADLMNNGEIDSEPKRTKARTILNSDTA